MNTPWAWQMWGCPESHVEAYREPKWRKVIDAERGVVEAKMKLESAQRRFNRAFAAATGSAEIKAQVRKKLGLKA